MLSDSAQRRVALRGWRRHAFAIKGSRWCSFRWLKCWRRLAQRRRCVRSVRHDRWLPAVLILIRWRRRRKRSWRGHKFAIRWSRWEVAVADVMAAK